MNREKSLFSLALTNCKKSLLPSLIEPCLICIGKQLFPIFPGMNVKRLFRIAAFTSPLLAIFALTPIYILSQQDLNVFWIGGMFLTLFCFLIWSVNILILLNYSGPVWKRLVFSYVVNLLLVAFFILLRKIFIPIDLEDNAFFPVLNALAVNTFVLIIMDNILTRERKNQAEIELQELKVKNLEAQQQLLIQQFRPHFLFNALSTLKSLMLENVDEAEAYLLKLSEFLRFSVQAHQNKIVSLEKELRFAREYLEMQQIRFEDSLFCEFEVPEEALGKRLPVFAVQSLIENAIKHNAFSPEKPLRLQIRYQNQQLTVSNNKIPKAGVESNGTGLHSLNRRHELVTGTSIDIQDRDDQFSVSFSLLEA
jgi:two-component system LytT family sensor kinase